MTQAHFGRKAVPVKFLLCADDSKAPGSKVREECRIRGCLAAAAVCENNDRPASSIRGEDGGVIDEVFAKALKGGILAKGNGIAAGLEIDRLQRTAGGHGFGVVIRHGSAMGKAEKQERQRKKQDKQNRTREFQKLFHLHRPFTAAALDRAGQHRYNRNDDTFVSAGQSYQQYPALSTEEKKMRQRNENVSPMSNEGRNRYVVEHITAALLRMMENSAFDEITISALCASAEVGRASFYRNFEGKKDVLKKHLAALLKEWGREFEAGGDAGLFAESLLKHYYKYREVYLLLYRQNLSEMIYETIRQAIELEKAENNLARYGKAMFAGMLFGWVDEWMRQGMPETPEELAVLMAQSREKERKEQ